MDREAAARGMLDIMKRIHYRPFYVVDTAPEDYPSLRSIVSVRLPIFGPYSDKTIFIEPMGNIIQRAIHDTVHLEIGADTSVDGEYRVAIEQCRLFAQHSSVLADVMFADLRGQTLYYGRHGQFPTDQVGFTYHWLKTRSVEEIW